MAPKQVVDKFYFGTGRDRPRRQIHALPTGKHPNKPCPLENYSTTRKGVRKDYKEEFYETNERNIGCDHY